MPVPLPTRADTSPAQRRSFEWIPMTERVADLQIPVDDARDHIRGPVDAPVTLVAYADYQCPYCLKLRAIVQDLQDHLGARLRVVFRHFPIDSLHPFASGAAEAAEAASAQGRFWEMHEYLYAHQHDLDTPGLERAAAAIGLDVARFRQELSSGVHASRVRSDADGARKSGVVGTPTLFLNGIRYDGAWDFVSLLEAVEKPLGARVELIARRFAGWAASGGFMLLASALIAMVLANSPWSEAYLRFWETEFSLGFGEAAFSLSLHHWVNDGLMVLFFFVVGLEIKREVTSGELADRKRAALPIAGALGGMLVPALIYMVVNRGGPGASGWGVPMATDIAFTLGLLALLGRRVPFALLVFVSALAIADDLGAILVIAFFYTESVSFPALGLSALIVVSLIGLSRSGFKRPWPYALLGAALWATVLVSGIHPTIAGVVLAMTIPLHSKPDTGALLAQSTMALDHQQGIDDDVDREAVAVRTLETVIARLESPADRIRRRMEPWTAYGVLPLFAMANAGIPFTANAFDMTSPISLGILLGLGIGKPVGIALFAWAATRIGLAKRPDQVEWVQILGAACLCGIGFTMSLFIATAAFADAAMLAEAKISVILASVAAAIVGGSLLVRFTSPATQSTRAAGATA